MSDTSKTGIGIVLPNSNQLLHKFSKGTTLLELIDEICKLEETKAAYIKENYGLQFVMSKTQTMRYVTEENFQDIKDGDLLNLVISLKCKVKKIFDKLEKTSEEKRKRAFDDLMHFSMDPGFIKEMIRQDKVVILKAKMLENITQTQFAACLAILIHMISMNKLEDIEENILEAVVKSTMEEKYSPESIQYSVDFLRRILEKRISEKVKNYILLELKIRYLKPLLWDDDHPHLQTTVIMLINAMLQNQPEVDRLVMINNELNSASFKSTVYKYILYDSQAMTTRKISQKMAAALYTLQIYMLWPLKSKLEHLTRYSTCYDFFYSNRSDSNDNLSVSSRCSSMESLTDSYNKGTTRERYNSITSRDLLDEKLQPNYEEICFDESKKINFLTVDCMRITSMQLFETDQNIFNRFHFSEYFKNHFPKSYARIRMEADLKFFDISEDLVQGLSRLLDIGKEPERRKNMYQPLVFLHIQEKVFIYELFCFTIWLFEKNKREMRAKIDEDYQKVLRVVLEGIHLVLQEHPVDYKNLKDKVQNMSYHKVSEHWKEEENQSWMKMMKNHPSILELKSQLEEKNENLVYEERINWMIRGDKFPKHPEKKGKTHWQFLKLSSNKKMLVLGDWDDDLKKYKQLPQTIYISSIQHLITSGACPHYKDNKSRLESNRCFSLSFENDEGRLDFYGKNRKATDHWIDGLNYLLNKNEKSKTFYDDLENLVEMEVSLKLLDLQNIPLPTNPPQIPSPPLTPGPKPSLPKKTLSLYDKISRAPPIKLKSIP